MEGNQFDLKLIPDFDGSTTQSVVEWLEKLTLVCRLRGVKDVASVIPLRLTGGAFAVYLQMSEDDRKSTEKIKEVLLAAFAQDSFMAYEQFVDRKLHTGESPDVYLADLRHLASLFGGVSDQALACAFVTGLPDDVRQLLRAGSRMESLNLDQIVSRVRAVIRDDGSNLTAEACLGATRTEARRTAPDARCFECNGVNHFARDCLARRKGEVVRGSGNRSRQRVRCYKCGGLGHISSTCPSKERSGNVSGEGESAPPFSPAS